MLYMANRSASPTISLIGWRTHDRSTAIFFDASVSLARWARIWASTGSGPIDAAVDQHAVVVDGDSSANLARPPSWGRKCTRPLEASSAASNACGREYFAAISVGATSTTRVQNSGGNE